MSVLHHAWENRFELLPSRQVVLGYSCRAAGLQRVHTGEMLLCCIARLAIPARPTAPGIEKPVAAEAKTARKAIGRTRIQP